MRCLETRRKNGMKWRRYRTEEGARLETYEVPATVIRYLGTAVLSEALRRAKEAEDRARRNARMIELFRQGWKVTALASEFRISDAMARRIVQPVRGKQ